MRQVDLSRRGTPGDPRTARLTRHLKARLEDFGPGGPKVEESDQQLGLVRAVFPGRDTAQVLKALEAFGVQAGQEGEQAVFALNPQVEFEQLDYVWGCLFQVL